MSICIVISGIFVEFSENGRFFMQFVYFTPKKQRVGRIFLEGYHTYKRKFLCYNRLVSLQKIKRRKTWQAED